MPATLSPRMEDYLEAVLVIQQEHSVARVTELAEALEVSKPTVTGALKTLKEGGFVDHQSYGYVTLTDRGRRRAKAVRRHHRLLTGFFENVLGVDPGRAAEDACSAEHYISRGTLDRLASFIEFIDDCPRTGEGWLEHFQCFFRRKNGQGRPEGCDEQCRERCLQEVAELEGDAPCSLT